MQWIFNPKKVLENWALGLFSYTIKSCVYWRLLRSPMSPTYIALTALSVLDLSSTSPTCLTYTQYLMVWLESPMSQLFKTFFRIENPLNIKQVMSKKTSLTTTMQQCYSCLMSETSEMWNISIKDLKATLYKAMSLMSEMLEMWIISNAM